MPRESTLTRDQKSRILRWFSNANIPPVPLIETDALLLSGTQEFAYNPTIVTDNSGPPARPFNALRDWLTENRINFWNPSSGHPAANNLASIATWEADFRHFIRDDITGLPTHRLILDIHWYTAWTGSGAYTANKLRIRPALSRDVKDRLAAATDWTIDLPSTGSGANVYTGTTSVANPAGAGQNPLLPGAADAGFQDLQFGTPTDSSIRNALIYLKTLGYDIGISCTPQFLDFSGGTGEGWQIWRGNIGASSGTWASAADFQTWMNEWRTMFHHYAVLTQKAGIVPWCFILGSSLTGITKNASQEIRERFLVAMHLAAREVHDVLGPTTNPLYLPDWSEYHGDSATALLSFPVDALQSNILFPRFGLHWKPPIADMEENSPCDLAEGVFHGEGEIYSYTMSGALPYSATHRYLVDGADPSDEEGKTGLVRVPLDSGYAYKNLPAAIEGAHYVSASNFVISDPTPPADWAATVRARVSPCTGTYIEMGGGLGLGGVTLSNLVGPSAIVQTDLAAIYALPVGLGVRTAPWQLLKWLVLDGVDDYYAFKLPTYSRQYRVSGTGDPIGSNIRNLNAASATNVQPGFLNISHEPAEPNWYNDGMYRYRHDWQFECVVEIGALDAGGGNVRHWIAFGRDSLESAGIPFFGIGLKKVGSNAYYEFTFKARRQNATDESGWTGAWEDEFFQASNRIYPSDAGHTYRIQMKLSSTPDNPHPVPYAECRVWDVTAGNKEILNQAIGTGGEGQYWFGPGAGGTVILGAGLNSSSDPDLVGFWPGKIFYAGMWEWKQGSWGGHFWLDDGYASANSIRTGWLPGQKQAFALLGYQSMAGMESEPNITPTLFADTGAAAAIPSTFADYPYWRRLRERYSNAKVYDLSGAYGAKFYGDERKQALALAIAAQQFHNTMVRRTDGALMSVAGEVVIDRFDVRSSDVQMAPNESGTALYYHQGPIRRVNHDSTGKLWPRLARAGSGGRSSGAGPESPPNPPGSVTPFPIVQAPSTNAPGTSANAAISTQQAVSSALGTIADSRTWYGQ